MAKDISPSASSVSSVPKKSTLLPYRQFKDWPTSIFIDSVLKRLRETASPENIDELCRNPIPKTVKFQIIKKITLDGKRRPEGGHAPCPMCTPNRFLSGALVFIPEMQCCAVIGHCCADRDSRAEAERDFKRRSKQEYEENYLIDNLLFVIQRLEICKSYVSAAHDALKLYRKFRRDASLVQHQLRHVVRNYAGRLVVSEVIRGGEEDDDNDYVGPAGLKGRGTAETRDHDFGLLSGILATVNDYNPEKELQTLIRQLQSIDEVPSEDRLLDFIVGISPAQRKATVAVLEMADKGAIKFAGRLTSFRAFFERENAERLSKFSNCQHNNFQFNVMFELIHKRPMLTVTHRGAKCSLHVGEALQKFNFTWPGKTT